MEEKREKQYKHSVHKVEAVQDRGRGANGCKEATETKGKCVADVKKRSRVMAEVSSCV